jgi:hypothetical protein
MNIKPIIVKSYLESLTEESELNRIFPILLTSMGFEILTQPTENKGFTEYGKDIVAVGKDSDGIKKRFYFELKGGNDKDIKATTLTKKDGIIESLREAKYAEFDTTFKNFNSLKKTIVLVHNGELKGSARKTFKGFIEKEFPNHENIEFERWDIERLSKEFTNNLFGAYLLTDKDTTRLFNKVLINLNVYDDISIDFIELLERLFNKNKWEGWNKKRRKWLLLFETLKLISFIIYTESKEYNNLNITKRYLTHLILKFWYWILKNNLENNKKVRKYFDDVLYFYYSVLDEYFERTLKIAYFKDGLSSTKSGKYEQIGYTKRTFEYLEYLSYYLGLLVQNQPENKSEIDEILTKVIGNNSVSCRPLIDINSNAIINILDFYLQIDKKSKAIEYLKGVLSYIINGKEKYGRLPDANNSYENVIRFIVTGEKSVYYSDFTSPLLSVLLEYTIVLNLEDLFNKTRDFIIKHEIDLGIFTPHHGKNSKSKHLIENKIDDLEEQLFSNSFFNDGYQRDIPLKSNDGKILSFEDFKMNYEVRVEEFEYDYRTDKVGYSNLRALAHIYFRTPFFPDKWRLAKVN